MTELVVLAESKGERTYLTKRQLEILQLRRSGKSQAEVAVRLGITRQDVSILEKRALRNLKRAAATLEIAVGKGIVTGLTIPKGTHILDVAKQILERANSSGIRLADNMVTVVSAIKTACSFSMKDGIVSNDLEVSIFPDGRLFFSLREGSNIN